LRCISLPAKHVNTKFQKDAIVKDRDWLEFVQECVSVIIKDGGKPCGACGGVLSVGDVACKVIMGKAVTYYCHSCFKKMKKQRIDYAQKKQTNKDKFAL